MRHSSILQEKIVQFARELGFHLVGFAQPKVEEKVKKQFLKWLEENKHAGLWYLEEKQRLFMRFHPEKLMGEVKNIIVFGVSYKDNLFGEKVPKDKGYISVYALRRDYHKVIKKKLKKVSLFIKNIEPFAKTRIFVDSAPVLERYFAYKAGLGFIGKNNFLINPLLGGLIFLGEIFTNLEFKPSEPIDKKCGACTLCIDSCPTGALLPFNLDMNLCISYHTIENRNNPIPVYIANKMDNRIFGCDECAIACPYNKRENNTEPFFKEEVLEYLQGIPLKKLALMTKEDFDKLFSKTPIKRAGYIVFLRNVIIALYNSKVMELINLAEKKCKESTHILIKETCKELGLLD